MSELEEIKKLIKHMEETMGQGLLDLQNDVAALTTAVSSATTLITSLNSQISTLTTELATANATIATLQSQLVTVDQDSDVEAQAQVVAEQTAALNTAVATN